tara:strand:- start:3576 stop:4235 length:660 start_codon:yes stop_codon:yes gene_type:complete
MKFKLIIFILIVLKFNFAISNVIYDKNDHLITEFDLKKFQMIHDEILNKKISKQNAIKQMILIKNTIKFLSKSNPEFVRIIDEEIKSQISKEDYENSLKKDFYRYLKVRNQFIAEYYAYEFDIEDLKILFKQYSELKLPLSQNDCLTIEKFEDLKDNSYFIDNFFENIKKKSNNFIVEIDDKIYDVCINQQIFNKLESSIINFIEKNTEKRFLEFIYRK